MPCFAFTILTFGSKLSYFFWYSLGDVRSTIYLGSLIIPGLTLSTWGEALFILSIMIRQLLSHTFITDWVETLYIVIGLPQVLIENFVTSAAILKHR
jgi:hypothetical protein